MKIIHREKKKLGSKLFLINTESAQMNRGKKIKIKRRSEDERKLFFSLDKCELILKEIGTKYCSD